MKQYFFRTIWFLNQIITYRLGELLRVWGYKQHVARDHGWIESLGPQGLNKFFNYNSYILFREQSLSFFLFLRGLVCLLVFFVWKNSLN